MTAKSHSNGNEVYFDKKSNKWKLHSGIEDLDALSCKKCEKYPTTVKLCQPREHSKRTEISVDKCIAPLVQMLNDYGVRTMGACCGHGTNEGGIFFEQDGENILLTLKKS